MSTEQSTKRLHKSRTDKILAGVCGGIAEYLGIDSTLVRVGWILLVFAGGVGILLYLVAMILMPKDRSFGDTQAATTAQPPSNPGRVVGGAVLVGIGLIWLLRNLGVFTLHSFFWLFSGIFFPILLIVAGIALLLKNRVEGQTVEPDETKTTSSSQAPSGSVGGTAPRRIFRSRLDRKIFGVCGGLAKYFDVDVTLVRIFFVVSAFLSFGLTIAAYILLAIMLSEEPFVLESR